MGPKLKCMRKKYQDVNSELWGKTQNENYGEKLKISGCQLRIMGKNSEL